MNEQEQHREEAARLDRQQAEQQQHQRGMGGMEL